MIENGMGELDSELDNFLAEIDDIESTKQEPLPTEPDKVIWKECLDKTTKHPYYWHTRTQEVTWTKPDNYDNNLVEHETAMRQWKKKCEEINQLNEERQKKAEERQKISAAELKPTNSIRKTPKIELENDTNVQNGAGDQVEKFGKMGKFNFLKSEAEQKESSPGPTHARLTFKVKKPMEESPPTESEPMPEKLQPVIKRPKTSHSTESSTSTLPAKQRTVTEIAAEIKKKKQQIAITNARILLQKRVEEQKQQKRAEEQKLQKKAASEEKAEEKPASPTLENKKRRIFQEIKVIPVKKEVDREVKRAVEKEAVLLKEKLEFLGGDLVRLSKFQIHIIALDTRLSDFIGGHISEPYMQSKLTELGQTLRAHEENSVPKDWTCTFDRDEKRYRYTNKITGKSQFTHPGEDDASSSDSDSDMEDVTPPRPDNDKNDELYELFQQEIKVIEDKTKEDTPTKKTSPLKPSTPSKKSAPLKPPTPKAPPRPSTPKRPKLHKSATPKNGHTPKTPPCSVAPPAAAPPPVPKEPVPVDVAPPPVPPPGYQDYHGYVDPWAPYSMMMGHAFQGMMGTAPPVPPPPPPDDGMMEAYSPGNSDSEEDKRPDDNLGVVSVKAPMRYATPPPSDTKGDTVVETETTVEPVPKSKEETPKNIRRIIKKKKKPEVLNLSGANKKHKNMNSLVAKWNQANKNADVAMK